MNVAAKLTVPRVDPGCGLTMERIDSLFETWGLPLHVIDRVNWPVEFPDQPSVGFRIAHSGDRIYLKYYVEEQATRAVYETDGNRPWEESCVEFFVNPAGDDIYYNLEMSCIGYGILNGGAPGNRSAVPGGVEKIGRLPSMPRHTFGIREGAQKWTLTLAIPMEVFSLSQVAPLSGRSVRANFYKCGDLLPRPHYLSWSGIETPTPDFHKPRWFGELFFE
jgi:hypothetical protein